MSSPLPHAVSPVVGEFSVPGSKSETNRALLIAAVADGVSTIDGALVSRDTLLMLDALRRLGVDIDRSGPSWIVAAPPRFAAARDIDCGLAGTVMRFVPPLALIADGPCSFVGDAQASKRPMAPLADALRQLGSRVDGDALPLTVHPAAHPGSDVSIDASTSSQFVSGMLLVAPRLPEGLRLVHTGQRLPSRPHIAMTVEMLRARGVSVEEQDERSWVVAPGPVEAGNIAIEPDLTNAAVFLAAAMLTGGSVTIPGWPSRSLQPGALFLDLAQRMGARVSRDHNRVTVSGDQLIGIDTDLTEASELTPVVAALAALADGTTTIRGVAHVRGHETDRLAALAAELTLVGAEAEETPDGLRIVGTSSPRPARLRAYADHRMVHAAALLALRAPGTSIDDLGCVSKTMPDFERDWARLVRP